MADAPDPDADASTPADVARQRPPRRRSKPRRLIDTVGPDPSDPIENVRLTVGRLGGPHGVHGEIRMVLLTDVPEHLLELDHVYLGNADTPTALENLRFHGDVALLSLNGVTTPEEARKLGGLAVRIAGTDARPLEEGEYFLYQLIGLRAITRDGDDIGVVVDLIETGASDVLVIAREGSGSRSPGKDDILVPNHPVYVHEITPEDGVIVITLPVYPEDAASS